MLNTSIGRLRLISLVEGVSFVLLLGIAMPLKYMAGMPEAVRVVGMAHGILWVMFIAAVIDVWATHRWPLSRVAGALVASVLPFGPFVLEARLRREGAGERPAAAAATEA